MKPMVPARRRRRPDLQLSFTVVNVHTHWSHPKGKLKRGEDPLTGAVREVVEETGYTASPGTELPTLRYLANGRPKQVRYWAAEAGAGGFVPNTEVDRILWLPPTAARNRLTQPRDRDLVDALLDALRLT